MDDRVRELERLARNGNAEAIAALRVARRRLGLGHAPFLPRCVRCEAEDPPIHVFDAAFCTDLPEKDRAQSLCLSCLEQWHTWRNEVLSYFLIRLGSNEPREQTCGTLCSSDEFRWGQHIGAHRCWRCDRLGRSELNSASSRTSIDHPRAPLQSRGGTPQSRNYLLCHPDYMAWVKISSLMFLDFLDGWGAT